MKNDLYRQHILEAAEQVFAERGFESAKLSEISATADLSMGTIYAIFPGKEDLFRAILDQRGQELLQIARGAAAPRPDAAQALEALIEAYIDYFVDHPGFLRMYLRLGTSWVLGPSLGTESQVRLWSEIHALQADDLPARRRARRVRRRGPRLSGQDLQCHRSGPARRVGRRRHEGRPRRARTTASGASSSARCWRDEGEPVSR